MGEGNGYFYSIQPFWNGSVRTEKEIRDGGISICRMEWENGKWTCVPGNGQIGVIFTEPERFQAICYGVLSEKKEISLYSVRKGILVRFSPGIFSRIFSVPACAVRPEGTALDEILPAEKIGKLKDRLGKTCPERELLLLLKQWEEERKTEKRAGAEGNLLASQVQQLIWERRGAVKIKDLERETFYSARRLQEVIVQQIGIAPKQLCRQTRFQHALRDALSMQKLCMAQEAYGHGYCDQAHYSREFKEFMGICPRKILAESEKV